ncbi:MAG: hypothetical protein Q8922_09600 [Bacteroidota bacterium]|nr:hypothetical protein [Bacteroidota bacterium]MDP4234446.1 hypothetical protein [Bacteroidota bacterium]MDP4243972.1 hypothetical protein [Bacteroidota bacterium]MDP4288178.1 hypothetical protein [Bacteroidota bacterium]
MHYDRLQSLFVAGLDYHFVGASRQIIGIQRRSSSDKVTTRIDSPASLIED